jgi:fluoride exporter
VSLAVLLGVGLVGGLGAIGRFLLDGAVSGRVGRSLPWGTLAVNITGAFLLGAVVGATVSPDALRLAGAGVLGAFTTFSTWVFESHRLAEDGRMAPGVANFVVSIVLGLGAAWLGRHLGAAL